ncbi:MAG: HAMP domain-containing histidine kinase [Oscillospiraceae bacterium]|nr:HAMP domain-containing histidine kinase [Oscillospiraceae bacterium]
MNKALYASMKRYITFSALLLIIVTVSWLWANLPEEHVIRVYSNNATWDLRDFNFESANPGILGRVEFIPISFLSPDEFAERTDEISLRYPTIRGAGGTVRLRFLLPGDAYYVFTRTSSGYSDSIFVNGEWLRDLGNPGGNDRETRFAPRITFAVRPVNGVVEIVHQQSNFTYVIHGVYRGGGLDMYNYNMRIRQTEYTTNIMLGILLALTIISLLLYLLLYQHAPALLFALFCFLWFLAIGARGVIVFTTTFPWLDEPIRFRFWSTIITSTSVMIYAIIHSMFPQAYNKYAFRFIFGMGLAWTIYLLFADMEAVMNHGTSVGLAITGIAVFYSAFATLRKMHLSNPHQFMLVVGTIILGYTALREAFFDFNNNVPWFNFMLPPFEGTNFTRIGAITLLLCLASAVFMAIMEEMKKSKEAEQHLAVENAALESLSRMKTEFMANLSHEIKTPLTVVLNDIQRIGRESRKQGLESEKINESISRAKDEIMRMARLTESAIKMAALQENREKAAALDPTSLFITAAEGYFGIIEKQNNALIINAEENLPHIYGNADQLIGVLLNLLANSNKHTSKGELIVSIEAKEQFVFVTVKDNGMGIPTDILPHVFERGVSGSGSTGMGLAICKNTVESHGGTIRVNSEIDKGTEVVFTIPITDIL